MSKDQSGKIEEGNLQKMPQEVKDIFGKHFQLAKLSSMSDNDIDRTLFAIREAYIAGMQDKEKEAIEFVEWIDSKNYWFDPDDRLWRNNSAEWGTAFTTKELYQLFKQHK